MTYRSGKVYSRWIDREVAGGLRLAGVAHAFQLSVENTREVSPNQAPPGSLRHRSAARPQLIGQRAEVADVPTVTIDQYDVVEPVLPDAIHHVGEKGGEGFKAQGDCAGVLHVVWRIARPDGWRHEHRKLLDLAGRPGADLGRGSNVHIDRQVLAVLLGRANRNEHDP